MLDRDLQVVKRAYVVINFAALQSSGENVVGGLVRAYSQGGTDVGEV
jgi:hypothetical protein